jgi:putative transcriptional regulator
MPVRSKNRKDTASEGYLEGQFLVAMPAMADKRFARSVIYMCAHSAQGAMGLIINQRAPHITFSELLGQLSISGENDDPGLQSNIRDMDVHVGGPVETARGFVLHSSDYFAADSTLAIDDGISLTATVDILKAIARGQGPDRAILALGYAGWRPGQLESEIQGNGWLNCPVDMDLLFDPNLEQKYDRAMSKIGIDPSHLVSEAGHA